MTKQWFVTNITGPNLIADKLNELEAAGHTIFSVVAVSGIISVVSYTEAP